MESLIKDLRFGLRMLAKNPAFTLVALAALALGIGANTAIFSVVNAVLLRPLPYRDSEDLVKLWGRFTGIGIPNDLNWISGPEFVEIRDWNKSFSHIAAIQDASYNVTLAGVPERIEGARVSAAFFPMLGVEAQTGRVFSEGEDQSGRDNVVILSHGLWQRRFSADPNVAGRPLVMSGRSFTVIGVLPADFQFPGEPDLWTPLAFAPQDLTPGSRGSHQFEVLARIRPELTPEQARADAAAVTRRIIEQNRQYPYEKFNFALILNPLLDEVVGEIRTGLWILMGAVGFVLLIACANVANLMLARASAREREVAIRAALGAGRGRLIRQFLTESVVLALAGGAAGLLLARWGLSALTSAGATVFPRLAGARMDAWVLAFTMLMSLGTGVLFGLAPALHSRRAATYNALKEGGRSATTGTGTLQLRRLLVVLEVALSLVLLAGAGLLIKSFLRLLDVDPGFRIGGALTMRIALPQARYSQPAQVRGFFRDLLERVRKLPGVEAAGAISALPLSGAGGSGTVTIDTRAVPLDQSTPEADWRVVTPGFFDALGIRLLRGRYIDERDTDTSAPVAVVDETLANTYWPGEDAVGKRLKRGGLKSTQPWLTVVGVVRHVRFRTLEAQSRVQLYMAHAQVPWSALSLAVRTPLDPRVLATAVQRQVQAMDPDQPVYRVRTIQELLAESMARRRLSLVLFGLFAGVALLLAAVGIYGVISYSVTERAHEMGIRMALGASRGHVLRLVLGQSLSLALAGVALGLAGSVLLTGLMSTLLFNVKAIDAPVFLEVSLALAAVAAFAGYLPARRATRMDPMHTLRQE